MSEDMNAVEVFLMPQDIIRHNYMFHDEISNAVKVSFAGFKLTT